MFNDFASGTAKEAWTMKKLFNKRPGPFSLHLTFEERAQLKKGAAGLSLSAYIKWRVFDPDKPPPCKRCKAPVKDYIILGVLLASLDRSRLASNINKFAKTDTDQNTS